MHAKALVVIATMLSFSALADVSFEEKLKRVEVLESLPAESTTIDSYRRELSYELKGLSFEVRAKTETNLLASKIRAQIAKAYEASLAETNSSAAAHEEVKKAILQDLELAAPELKEELTQFSLSALDDAGRGSSSSVELEKTQDFFMEASKDRSDYLNHESKSAAAAVDSSRPSKITHKTKAEFLDELTSEGDGTFVRGANVNVSSEEYKSSGGEVSLQVKLEFLGAKIDAGPMINFRRDYTSTAIIIAEGLTPFLLPNGNFDLWKRDSKGAIQKANGKEIRRNTAFSCQVDLRFSTTYSGGGGFSYAGVGGSAKFTKAFTHSVSLTSRRILLPDYVDNNSVTVKYLAEICHNSFANAKVNKGGTVKQTLNLMMKNVVAGLTFSHPETKCITDSQCNKWFNNEVIALHKINNYPRCVESREKFRACVLRGKRGQNCPVYENGKLVSEGSFEYACDVGLKCVKTKDAGWFKNFEIYQHAEGTCQPVNPKTYTGPSTINVRFVK